MKIMRLLFLAAVLLVAGKAQAVVDTLSLSPNALNFLPPNGVFVGDTMETGSIELYNLGDSIFHDTVQLYYTINGHLYTLYSTSNGMSLEVNLPDVVTIQPHDSINLGTLQFYFGGGTVYDIGPNAVVIWPIAYHDTVFVQDSASTQIRVYGTRDSIPSGINQPIGGQLKVYIQGQQLQVHNDNKSPIVGVRIYDSMGRLLLSQEIPQNAVIPMDQFAAGVYFAEIIFRDERREVVKVFNMPNR